MSNIQIPAGLRAVFPNVSKAESFWISSFTFIENAVDHAFSGLAAGASPDTAAAVAAVQEALATKTDEELAFLIAHSGFIPDHYGDDSSEETLSSKLVEALVGEWGERVGFSTVLPTQKGSKEDITITTPFGTVVADAKSFRLSRSQAAPNVKDVIKLADYQKWLGAYAKGCGGLITYPAKFLWQRGSDVFLYVTDARSPVVLLTYEHLGVILLLKSKLPAGPAGMSVLWDYRTLFPNMLSDKRTNQFGYWGTINSAIASMLGLTVTDLDARLHVCRAATQVAVTFYRNKLNSHIEGIKKGIRERIAGETSLAALKRMALDSEIRRQTGNLERKLGCIDRFRI